MNWLRQLWAAVLRTPASPGPSEFRLHYNQATGKFELRFSQGDRWIQASVFPDELEDIGYALISAAASYKASKERNSDAS